ncbi:unnamed protein product [Umbelopsis sp. WA50703]
MTLPDHLSAEDLKVRAKEMNRLRQAKYRARRAQDEEWKAQNRERNRIRKQRQREREKAARPKSTRRQPLRRGARIGISKQTPNTVSNDTNVHKYDAANSGASDSMTAPEKRHDSPYSSSTEIPTSRSIQQDRATNIDAEEANAVAGRARATSGMEKKQQGFRLYELTTQNNQELDETDKDTRQDEEQEIEKQLQESQKKTGQFGVRAPGLWQNFKSMTDSYFHKVLNQQP